MYSNLGGTGIGEAVLQPQVLRYHNVGADPATGRLVDLEVQNKSLYVPWNSAKTGFAEGGNIAQINLAASRFETRHVDLEFHFVDSETSAPVVLERFTISLFDFDQGSLGSNDCVGLRGYSSVQLSAETQIVAAPDPSEPGNSAYCGSQLGHEGQPPSFAKSLHVRSCCASNAHMHVHLHFDAFPMSADDNPRDPMLLTGLQQSRTVQFIFTYTDMIQMRYEIR
eukprot:7304706-Prymnesium_polylepis.1